MATPQPDPVATAQGLTKALGVMAAEVKELRTYGRRNRKFIWFDIILTVVLTAVSVVAVYAVQSASTANSTADQNRVSAIAACVQTNIARAQNEQLWDYLIGISAPRPGESAAQKARAEKALAEIRAKVATTFAPRDCKALYPPGK